MFILGVKMKRLVLLSSLTMSLVLLQLMTPPLVGAACCQASETVPNRRPINAKPRKMTRHVNPAPYPQPRPARKRTKNPGKKSGRKSRKNNATFSHVSNFSDPSRFARIKADARTASNEIAFWARQMSEHALFSHLGLEEPKLKKTALQAHKKFEDFRKRFQAKPMDLDVMNQILPLLKEQREFQVKLLQLLEQGAWIGWTFPLFVNHITLELDYFVDKLNGIQYTAQEEVAFWNRINGEHAAFNARFLDPSERELLLKADRTSVKFNKIPKTEYEMMVKLSLTATKELDEFNKAARAQGKAVKSIIHPVLLDHVIREGEHSIEILKSLGLQEDSERLARQHAQEMEQYNQPIPSTFLE